MHTAGFSVTYGEYYGSLSPKEKEDMVYGMAVKNGGSKPEDLIGSILTEITSMV